MGWHCVPRGSTRTVGGCLDVDALGDTCMSLDDLEGVLGRPQYPPATTNEVSQSLERPFSQAASAKARV